ncbi:hypothetical protein CALCODRAFT_518881 [Calocera cornea HHB12733]|uniref:Cyanovirin-N domain-containing protein n=1 Tax=Calocera cornea HHB12733 TaxID=1353952 RepID=A0A165EMV3_9BASI|nr:hypothetical protein CALCODRAFT_518881 [Calocera cornea HHB12733]
MRSFILIVIASLFALAYAQGSKGTVCGNQGLLGNSRPKKFVGECNRSDSWGVLSSHNCFDRGGSKYLCVLSGVATCIDGPAKLKKLNMEKGECFA